MNLEEHKVQHNQLGLSLDFSDYYLRDGSLPFTGNLDIAGYTISNATINSPTINSPTIAGATIAGGTFTGPTVSSGTFNTPILTSPSIDSFVYATHYHTNSNDGGVLEYVYLFGRSGGQHLRGGIDASEDLLLSSTSHATKGSILFGTSSVYDEANNRLGINTISPTQALDVVGSALIKGNMNVGPTAAGSNASINLGAHSSGNRLAFIDWIGDDTYSDYGFRILRDDTGANALTQFVHRGTGNLQIQTQEAADILFYTTNTIRMTIDATGPIGIGTTAPENLLHLRKDSSGAATAVLTLHNRGAAISTEAEISLIAGGLDYSAGRYVSISAVNMDGSSSQDMVFRTSNGAAPAERLRIQADGDVGIGGTPAFRLDVQGNVADFIARFFNDGNATTRKGIVVQCGEDTSSSTNIFFEADEGDGAATGRLQTTGAGVFALADVSDVTLKTDIAPTRVDAVEVIKGLELIEYSRVKGATKYQKNEIGFSAQNCKQVFPQMVYEDENGLLMTMRTELIPVLVKAIQDQQTSISLLEARIATLESSGKIG